MSEHYRNPDQRSCQAILKAKRQTAHVSIMRFARVCLQTWLFCFPGEADKVFYEGRPTEGGEAVTVSESSSVTGIESNAVYRHT